MNTTVTMSRATASPTAFGAGELLLGASDAAALRTLLDTLEHLNRTDAAAEAMDELIDGARIVDDASLPQDLVTLSTTVVEYRELPSGPIRTISLVLPEQANAAHGRVSTFSPVGRALLGRRVGQSTEAVLPNGARPMLMIVAVYPSAERAPSLDG